MTPGQSSVLGSYVIGYRDKTEQSHASILPYVPLTTDPVSVTTPALGTRAPLALPQGPNQHWSLDFLHDQLSDGRRFRILAILDDFTR
jgi:transposase InsO family protein